MANTGVRLEGFHPAEDGKASNEDAGSKARAQIVAEETGGEAVSTEDRVSELESAFVTLTRLVQSHGERFDTHLDWINQLGAAQATLTTAQAGLAAAQAELAAAQANSEQKIAALVDAQIRTEDELRRLAEQGAQANARIDRLVEQSAQANARVDRLAEMVERLMEGRNGQG